MPRTPRFAAALALLACALVGTAAHAVPAVRTIPVAEIRSGMRGYGLTVFRGTVPERFDLEVIDVLHNFRPGQDLILIRTDHPLLERAHIVGGMSGSPIYLDGRLAGAYAYGWPFGNEQVAGVTPIANMFAELVRPVRPTSFPGARPMDAPAPTPRARGRADLGLFEDGTLPTALTALRSMRERLSRRTTPLGLEPAATPVMLGGVPDEVARFLADELEPLGLHPMQAGGGGSEPVPGDRYVDGGGIAVAMARGDINLSAVGTVTHVDAASGRLVAFGHPMMEQGELGLPVGTARVLHILTSVQRSFKIAELVTPLGTLVHDRQSAIVIDSRLEPATIPVRVRVHGIEGAPRTEWNVRIASHRAITPTLLYTVLATALKSTAADQTDLMVRVRQRVALEGVAPVELEDSLLMTAGPGNAQPFMGLRTFALLEAAYGNPFVESRPTEVAIDLDFTFGRLGLSLLGASVTDAEVRPGEVVPVALVLRRFGAPDTVRVIEVPIPERLAGETIRLEIRPAISLPRPIGRVESLAEIVAYVRDTRSPNDLAVSIELPGRALAFPGAIAQSLPSSAIDALVPQNDTLASSPYAQHAETFHPMGAIVSGTASLELRVAARRPSR